MQKTQATSVWFANMKSPVYTTRKISFVFVQKIKIFWFVANHSHMASCMFAVPFTRMRICYANHSQTVWFTSGYQLLNNVTMNGQFGAGAWLDKKLGRGTLKKKLTQLRCTGIMRDFSEKALFYRCKLK